MAVLGTGRPATLTADTDIDETTYQPEPYSRESGTSVWMTSHDHAPLPPNTRSCRSHCEDCSLPAYRTIIRPHLLQHCRHSQSMCKSVSEIRLPGCKYFDDMFRHFDTIPMRVERTDGQNLVQHYCCLD